MKSFIKRGMSGLLAFLMCFTALFGAGSTTAFAASETSESYMISFPRDGDANQVYGTDTWGHPAKNFMNGWYTEENTTWTVHAQERFEGQVCYCIEPGVHREIGDAVKLFGYCLDHILGLLLGEPKGELIPKLVIEGDRKLGVAALKVAGIVVGQIILEQILNKEASVIRKLFDHLVKLLPSFHCLQIFLVIYDFHCNNLLSAGVAVSALTLQMFVVKVHSLDKRLGHLFHRGVWPEISAERIHRHLDIFHLIALDFGHQLHHFTVSKPLLLAHASQPLSLGQRRRHLVAVHHGEERFLLGRLQIGQLHCRSQGNLSVVHHLEDLGDQIREADIALDLVAAIAAALSK